MLKLVKFFVILSVLVFSINVAYANGNNEITVSSSTGLPNDIVTVNISISANTGCAAGSLNLQYDANKLLLISCVKGSALTGVSATINTAYNSNTLRVNWLSANSINAGNLFTITFKIKSDATGNADLLMQNVKLSDINANPVSFSISNGVVAIGSIPTSIPTATATPTATPTPMATPLAPTELTSPSKTVTTVDLLWTAVEGATGYNVYIAGTSLLTTTPITATTYTATGLNENTTYSFTVKAVNAGGESPASTALDVTTILLGDVTGDGIILPSDALKILQFVSGKVILTDVQKIAADVTKNGVIQPSDALKIIQFCSGKILSF